MSDPVSMELTGLTQQILTTSASGAKQPEGSGSLSNERGAAKFVFCGRSAYLLLSRVKWFVRQELPLTM